ncbi:MAG: outer membrane beta-barrel protein [Geovibrio sp.]|nr:outer membrane beta-barrel protein [Geovibrio sp.]
MDGEKYSDTFTLEAKGAYLMDSWRFYAPVSVTFRDYDTDTPADYNRDGTEYKGGLGVSKTFRKVHMASLEGLLSTEDTDGRFREVTSGELKLAYAGKVMEDLTLQLDYGTILYDYKNGGREDRYHSASAALLYKFMERHYVNLGYRFSLNDSNDDLNDYKKHVFDMGVSYFY